MISNYIIRVNGFSIHQGSMMDIESERSRSVLSVSICQLD